MASTKPDVSILEPSEKSPAQNSLYNKHDEIYSDNGRYVSEEEYWAHYYDRGDFSYEWNNGQLEERPVGDYAQFRLYLWFISLLKDFLHVNPIGRMIGLEMGFRMKFPGKTTIRKPDLGIVLANNPILLADKDRSYKGIFDLCIESLSDSTKHEVERDTVTKKLEYAAAGVKEYYILDENGVETAFYRLSKAGVYAPIPVQAGVIQSTILPGFRFRNVDLYHLPEPPQMIVDDVYSSFISPYFRAERLRSEQERERAEQERERAEQEKSRADREAQRAEQYAAMLRTLGVNLDEAQ